MELKNSVDRDYSRSVIRALSSKIPSDIPKLDDRNLLAILCLLYKQTEILRRGNWNGGEGFLRVTDLYPGTALPRWLDVFNEDRVWEGLSQWASSLKPGSLADAIMVPDLLEKSSSDFFPIPLGIRTLVMKLFQFRRWDAFVDMSCSCGNMLVSALEHVRTSANERLESLDLYDCERDEVGKFIAETRLKIAETEGLVEISEPFDRALRTYERPFHRGSKVWLGLPFGAFPKLDRLPEDLVNSRIRIRPSNVNVEWMYAELICNAIGEDGRAIGIFPNGFLNSASSRYARAFFVEEGLIETVITLPKNVFEGTAAQMSIVVFGRNRKSEINFVDASNFAVKGRRKCEISEQNLAEIFEALEGKSSAGQSVRLSDVCKADYSLLPNWYVSRTAGDIERVASRFGYRLVKFGELIEDCQRGAVISANDMDELESTETTEFAYLKLSNIQDGFIEGDITYLKGLPRGFKSGFVEIENILLSRNGNPFRIAIVDSLPESKVIANGNLYVIKIKREMANPYYIKAMLESPIGKQAMDRVVVGTSLPLLSIGALCNIELPLPPVEKQDWFAEKYCVRLERVKRMKRELADSLKELNGMMQKSLVLK